MKESKMLPAAALDYAEEAFRATAADFDAASPTVQRIYSPIKYP